MCGRFVWAFPSPFPASAPCHHDGAPALATGVGDMNMLPNCTGPRRELRRPETSDKGSSNSSVSFADAAATSKEAAPTPPYSLKRRASSTLSALLRRLSHFGSADEEEDEPEEPVTSPSFSMRLQKVMRIIGLSNSDSDNQPQLPPAEPGLAPAQPPPVVASLTQCSGIGVDDIAELSLEELVDKASPPLSPHVPTPTPSYPNPNPHANPNPNPNLTQACYGAARCCSRAKPAHSVSSSGRACCSDSRRHHPTALVSTYDG